MKDIHSYSLSFILLITSASSVYLYRMERERRLMKEDLIELSKVKYGLFNVDEWRKILAVIITKKVEDLNLQGTDKAAMRKRISDLLYKVIDDFEARYYEQKSKSLRGILESTVTSMFGAFKTIRNDVPKFTEQILDFMNDPRNRKAVRGYIIEKLNAYADDTFAKMDYSVRDEILARYQMKDRDSAINMLTTDIDKSDRASKPFKIGILALMIVLTVWVFTSKRLTRIDFGLLVALSCVLLGLGLILPMIEIDARIASMSFTLLGEPVMFTDQVLYYKSKSILEVVQLMLTQSRVDVFIVGILVFVFSVLFPVSKLFATLVVVYSNSFRENRFVQFLAFKTGKWSMADVMVIAIFMSYIGFSGIITEQLKQIESMASSMDILTTNKSSLLTGFFYFTAFAIFSLAVAGRLEVQSARSN